MSLMVYKPGTRVGVLDSPEVNAIVSQVYINAENCIAYTIVWWVGCERRFATVDEWEIVPTEGTEVERIGFK